MITNTKLIYIYIFIYIIILSALSFSGSAGSVTIVKKIAPSDPDTTFEYKLDGESVSITTKGGTGTITRSLSSTGYNKDFSYKLIEIDKENWQKDSASCDNGFNPPDIYVYKDQIVTCTFVNSQIKEVPFWDWFFSWILKIINPTPYKSSNDIIKPLEDLKSGEPDIEKKQEPVKISGKQPSASLDTERGHAILVPTNSVSKILKVEIYGSIYDNGNKQFDVEIWDKNLNTLQSSTYKYVDYFPNGGSPPDSKDFAWVTIDISDVDVSSDFYVALFTYSGPPSWHEKEEYRRVPPFVRGGIEIGVDTLTKPANSYVVERNPNRIVEWPTWDLQQDSTSWMIRVLDK